MKKIVSLLTATLFMIFILSGYNVGLQVHAANAPLISFSKSQYVIGVNKAFNVTLMIANVTDLVAWEVGIIFDPSILQYVTVTAPSDNIFGSRLLFNGGIADFVPNGTVATAGAALLPLESPFNGSGKLATMTFIMNATGTTTLGYDLSTSTDRSGNIVHDYTFLVDSQINEIAYTLTGCSINAVQSMSDVNNDGIVNMKDIVTAVAAFNSYPSTSRWNPYADIDNNGHIDLRDICLIVSNFGMNTSGTPSGGTPGIEHLEFLSVYANRTTDGWIAHVVIKNTGTTPISLDNSTVFVNGERPSDYLPYAPIENFGQVTLQIGDTLDLQFMLPGGSGSPWQSGSQFGIDFTTASGRGYATYFDMMIHLP